MSMVTVYPLRVKKYFFINYCYLVVDPQTAQAIIIDPAWELDSIEQKMQELKVDLKAILLTHSHPDHVNLAPVMAKRYQIPAYMSQAEIDYYGFHCPNLTAIETFKPFMLGEMTIKPIFTPGHTHGGTSYLIGDNLFCGDTLFIEGCGICTGKGADPTVMFNTLQLFKKIIPQHVLIYPGHCYGEPVGQNLNYVLSNNIYLQFDTPESFIAFRMRKSQNHIFKFV